MDTYDTRPMTPDWLHSVDVDRLADAHASHEFEYSLAELPRLREQLVSTAGAATGRVEFRHEGGRVVASLEVAATLALQCQRCMQPVSVPLRSAVEVALVDDLAAADAVPEEMEPVLINAGRVLLRELVEEELLLGVPLIPRHDDIHCAGAAAIASDAEHSGLVTPESPPAETTQKPFAELGELLKRRQRVRSTED